MKKVIMAIVAVTIIISVAWHYKQKAWLKEVCQPMKQEITAALSEIQGEVPFETIDKRAVSFNNALQAFKQKIGAKEPKLVAKVEEANGLLSKAKETYPVATNKDFNEAVLSAIGNTKVEAKLEGDQIKVEGTYPKPEASPQFRQKQEEVQKLLDKFIATGTEALSMIQAL
jgi:hypothetical protein